MRDIHDTTIDSLASRCDGFGNGDCVGAGASDCHRLTMTTETDVDGRRLVTTTEIDRQRLTADSETDGRRGEWDAT